MPEIPEEITYLFLHGFGAVFLIYKLSKLAYTFLRLMTTYGFSGAKFPFRNYGSWAVVTGATDGIGREYATQLASRGMNVVLVSRSSAKLAEVATDITNTYKVETKVIVADFIRGSELYPEVGRQLEQLDIGVLVNNVGMASAMGNFLDVPNREQQHRAVLNCNALSAVGMSCLVLPGMLAKHRGVVINISSMAGEGHNVLPEGVYSATKSFMSSLSRSLHVEYVSQGIVVQNITPGIVATKIIKNLQTTSDMPSACLFVRAALDTVGKSSDTCGCLRHQVTLEILNVLPRSALLITRERVMSKIKAGK